MRMALLSYHALAQTLMMSRVASTSNDSAVDAHRSIPRPSARRDAGIHGPREPKIGTPVNHAASGQSTTFTADFRQLTGADRFPYDKHQRAYMSQPGYSKQNCCPRGTLPLKVTVALAESRRDVRCALTSAIARRSSRNWEAGVSMATESARRPTCRSLLLTTRTGTMGIIRARWSHCSGVQIYCVRASCHATSAGQKCFVETELTQITDPQVCMHLIQTYRILVHDHLADQIYFRSALKAIKASYRPAVAMTSAELRVVNKALTADERDSQQDLKCCDSICKLGHCSHNESLRFCGELVENWSLNQ